MVSGRSRRHVATGCMLMGGEVISERWWALSSWLVVKSASVQGEFDGSSDSWKEESKIGRRLRKGAATE